MYSCISFFHPSASSDDTTPLMTAAPLCFRACAKGWMREWLCISSYSMVGMISEPIEAIVSTSERRVERRRDQEAWISGSWLRINDVLMSANREGRGFGSAPERDAKTDEISPSFRDRSRVWGCAAVARERARRGMMTPRGRVMVRKVESILVYCEMRTGQLKALDRKMSAYLYHVRKPGDNNTMLLAIAKV